LTPPHFKDIAWNGIQFSYPDRWQIAAIGDSHLVLEGSRGPMMEVAWSRIRGHFSHRTHFRKLASHFPKKMSASISHWELPPDWLQAVSRFEASGFKWRASEEGGKGVLLYCRACRRASLVHFFGQQPDGSDTVALETLKRFKDHYPEGGQVFSLFDMRATLPVPFELDRHRLDAGGFELVFGHRNNRLSLYRWALAAIVLQDSGLDEFGRQMKLIDPYAAQPVVVNGFDGVEERRDATGVDGWMRWMTSRPCHYWCRLWHVEACNRILGVVAETRRPMDEGLFERICEHYETF
jgi:hypothetical protein